MADEGFLFDPEELIYDAEPAFDDTPGISRVQELENALDKLLDLWDQDLIMPTSIDPADVNTINDAFDQAYAVLAQPEEIEEA